MDVLFADLYYLQDHFKKLHYFYPERKRENTGSYGREKNIWYLEKKY